MLVVLISAILALRSMRDYHETASGSKTEYSLYLVRNIVNLNHHVFDKLYEQIQKKGLVISLERLLKGRESALVIMGPKEVLEKFVMDLNLLELEDYTEKIAVENVTVWEVGFRGKEINFSLRELLQSLSLDGLEQLWWQVMFVPAKERGKFRSQIRVAAVSLSAQRRTEILKIFTENEHLSKLPKPYSTSQLYDFYTKRSLVYDSQNPTLAAAELLRII